MRNVAPDRVTIPLLGCHLSGARSGMPISALHFSGHTGVPENRTRGTRTAALRRGDGRACAARFVELNRKRTGGHGIGRQGCCARNRRLRAAGNDRPTGCAPQRDCRSRASRPRQSQRTGRLAPMPRFASTARARRLVSPPLTAFSTAHRQSTTPTKYVCASRGACLTRCGLQPRSAPRRGTASAATWPGGTGR